ncbi:putative PLANT SNARE 11 [Salix viminalis]|uniref:PLANT SNARE 11 n=1 Tax=Salix viminalis TaxID=40686 RepID=A0A9Q0YYM4_SALVM|nr:putative PLANT SNARE 11 [Salix viminalis]
MVKEIGRQVATDKCIMGLLFLIVIGVIAIIIVKTILFGEGRYLSRMSSFEIEPPANKLSFGWPSHILKSHFEIADNILSAINDGICIFYSGLKHAHEQLSSQDYRIHLVERTQCVFQRSSRPSIAKSPESNPLNSFIRKMPAQISLVTE